MFLLNIVQNSAEVGDDLSVQGVERLGTVDGHGGDVILLFQFNE